MKLLGRVLSGHDVVTWESECLLHELHNLILKISEAPARLVSKSKPDPEHSNAHSGLLRHLLTNIRTSLEQWRLERRIKSVLSER